MYITYCNAAREGLSRGLGWQAQKIGEDRSRGLGDIRPDRVTDKQTDRQTDDNIPLPYRSWVIIVTT